jgi:dolichol-phosphate mannosyltransferase
MGSRYFFILLYCLIEKFFSQGDFRKVPNAALKPQGGVKQ